MKTRYKIILLIVTSLLAVIHIGCSSQKPLKIVLPPDFEESPALGEHGATIGGPHWEETPYQSCSGPSSTELETWGKLIKTMSRCGLGQTAANPVLTSLANFPEIYEARVRKCEATFQPTFDIRAAVAGAEKLAGRKSVVFAGK